MSKLMQIAIIMIVNISAAYSYENMQCEKLGEVCVENGGARIIEGVSVTRPCWKYKTRYHCRAPIADYCQTIRKAPSCEQVGSKCMSTDPYDNKCNNYQNIFRCGSILNKSDNVVDLGNSYSLTNNTSNYNSCSNLDNQQGCVKISEVCIEGPETRIIGGKEIYKDCWKYKENYSCMGSLDFNNCKDIPKNCTLQSSSCLVDIGDKCNHRQNTYYCSSSKKKATNNLLCGEDVYCTDGQCDIPQDDEDSDFIPSISYMLSINEAVKDKNSAKHGENMKIFTGEGNGCEKNIAGYSNCCKDSGWGQDYANASCSAGEQKLMQLQSKQMCHYVGQYCSKKIPIIGKCKKTRKTFCCFKSKLSRVIVEQGRMQLGMGWGSAQSPDCRGFTPQEMQGLRFDRMDLSEVIQDIKDQVKEPQQSYIEGKIRKTMESYDQESD